MSDATGSALEIQNNSVPSLNETIASLGGKAGILTTLPNGTQAERLAVAAAVSNSDPIKKNLGKTIQVVNVVVQSVEMENEQTGEIVSVPRVVLVDDKGNTFHAISGPLFRDVRTMLGLVGMPDLSAGDKPIPVKILEDGTGSRTYFKLQYV